MTSSAARAMASLSPSSRSPSSWLTFAASSFIVPRACTKRRGLRRSLIGKLSRARLVWAPKRASRGTSTSPIESRSTRCGVSCWVMVPPVEARTSRSYYARTSRRGSLPINGPAPVSIFPRHGCATPLLVASCCVRRSALQKRAVNRKEHRMFAPIRYYHADPDSIDEVIQRTREGFVPLMRDTPGFVSYLVLAPAEREGEIVSVSVFEDEQSAQESRSEERRVG